MPARKIEAEICNCLALRQASRRLSQLYDEIISKSGIRGPQFSILMRLKRRGPMSVNELAQSLVMDRTTLGRNLRPLERDRLVALAPGVDRRRRDITLTAAGEKALAAAAPLWRDAQRRFEAGYGDAQAATLRAMLGEVAALEELPRPRP